MTSTMSKRKNWIVIEDDDKGWDPEMFNIPALYKDSVDSVMIPEGLIND